MTDSMASSAGGGQSGMSLSVVETPQWKAALGAVSAVLMAFVFLVAGVWKITDAPGAAVRMAQLKVPPDLSLAAAVGFGIVETFCAVLILVPRFRRWGAWLMSALLVAFMVYIGIHYNTLRGEECSCFPWIKRAVGPGFFIADGIMLVLAVLAGWWAKPSESLRSALLVLGAVSVFALVSYGVAINRTRGVQAPDAILVEGNPYPIREGKVFIYFFDPECSHCLDAGRKMAKMNWGDTKFVAVATVQPRFAAGFMQTTGLKGVVSTDVELLRKTFPFASTPAAVAIQDGVQKELLAKFDDDEPAATLKKLGFVY